MKMLEKMADDMKGIRMGMEALGKDLKESKEETKLLREEMSAMKEEQAEKEREWREERRGLQKEVQLVKGRMEMQDGNWRRRNIVVRGISVEEPERDLVKFLSEKLGVNVEVREAWVVVKSMGREIVVGELDVEGKKGGDGKEGCPETYKYIYRGRFHGGGKRDTGRDKKVCEGGKGKRDESKRGV